MSKASLELGGDNWAAKDGNLLGYAQGASSSKFVPREFTFTRGSDIAATRVNSSGVIEKYRENLLLQSNQFDNATWIGRSQTTFTGGQIGYDGSNDAWGCATTSGQIMGQNIVNQGVQTISVYAKGSVSNGLRIFAFGNDNVDFWVNLNTGLPDGSISSKVIDYSIEDVNGNGEWYRCSFTFSQTTSSIYFYCTDNNKSNAAGTIYIQDAQLEKGLVVTSYLESGATTAKAGVLDNLPRIDYTGGTASLLLEPQRTNLIEYSEYFEGSIWETVNLNVKNNNAISPEGVQNAAKICETTATNTRFRLRTNSSRTTSGDNVLSIYAKAEERTWIVLREQSQTGVYAFFNLSGNGSVGESTADNPTIEPLSDGWYKCSITDVLTAVGMDIRIALSDGVDSYDGVFGNGLYVYGAQIEQGSYPTSYIPTYGSSVTRSRDLVDNQSLNPVLGDGDLTILYDFNYDVTGREGSGQLFLTFSGTDSLGIKGTQSINRSLQIFSNGGFGNNITFNNSSPYATRHKVLLRITSDIVELFYNGSKHNDTINTNGIVGSYAWDRIKIDATNAFFAELNQVASFNTALTDSECIALTTL